MRNFGRKTVKRFERRMYFLDVRYHAIFKNSFSFFFLQLFLLDIYIDASPQYLDLKFRVFINLLLFRCKLS